MAMRSVTLLPKSGTRPTIPRRQDLYQGPTAVYRAGLMAVGAGLVLIPAFYAGMVGGALWLLFAHLTRHLHWIAGAGSSLPMGGLYLVITMVLGMLNFYLLRPFWPSPRRAKADLSLAAETEPRLYAFVQQICSALGAPVPVRIHVTMDVNASARFAPGIADFWQGRLELVLGLPLVRGLELGQFAGVLAHELGHFRQGYAMRLVHANRFLNQWFSNAAAREDGWEGNLSQRGHRVDPFLFLPIWCAKACARLVRLVLKAHIRAGQIVSCLLLRQMEFEADRAAIRMVGGEIFAGMVLEAKVLETAWALANRSLGMALREGRLADDLPALVAAHTRVFIPEVRRKMERTLLAEKTAWFDTHPSLGARIRHARRCAVRGVFHDSRPAQGLFRDFPDLAKQATMAFYRQDLGEDFNASRMISTADLVTGQSEIQVGEAAVSGYFLGLLTNLRPIWISAEDIPKQDGELLRASLREARDVLEKEAGRAADLFRAYSVADAKMLDAVQATSLMRANFWIEPTDFQLERGGTSQAGNLYRDAEAEQAGLAGELGVFEEAMKKRLAAALGLLSDPEVDARLLDARVNVQEVSRLLPSLDGLAQVQPRLEALRRTLHGMGILLENLDGNEGAGELRAQLRTHALAIRIELEAIGAGLAGIEYPFGFHSAGTGLAGYALDAMPPENDYPAHYNAAEETLGRCCALYFRILGRLALAAGRVEGVLGLGPLQVSGFG